MYSYVGMSKPREKEGAKNSVRNTAQFVYWEKCFGEWETLHGGGHRERPVHGIYVHGFHVLLVFSTIRWQTPKKNRQEFRAEHGAMVSFAQALREMGNIAWMRPVAAVGALGLV